MFSNFPQIDNKGNQILYLVNIEDLCKLVLKIGVGEIDNFFKPIITAHEKGKTFKNIFYNSIA